MPCEGFIAADAALANEGNDVAMAALLALMLCEQTKGGGGERKKNVLMRFCEKQVLLQEVHKDMPLASGHAVSIRTCR